jgi:4-hydroxy-tetrahydrodipicolinate synthase
MLEQLLRRQVDAGIPAVVISGTTGESATLTDEEKLEMFRRAKAYVGDSCRIIAGTGCNATSRTVELSVRAQQTGVDGLLIVSPYYNKTTQEGIIAHYLTVAHAVSIPIIAYNVPGRTGVDISVAACARLAGINHIVGIKEASEDITKTSRILSACSDVAVYSGNDGMIVPAMALGADGVISVISNVLPEQVRLMTDLMEAGEWASAAMIQRSLQPLIDALFADPNPIPVKAAMKMVGYDCGHCRLPLSPMRSENEERLLHLLKKQSPSP